MEASTAQQLDPDAHWTVDVAGEGLVPSHTGSPSAVSMERLFGQLPCQAMVTSGVLWDSISCRIFASGISLLIRNRFPGYGVSLRRCSWPLPCLMPCQWGF